jgi:hypothetical protein
MLRPAFHIITASLCHPRAPKAFGAALLTAVTFVSACVPVWSTKIDGLEPIAPSITNRTCLSCAPPVFSLQPELSWKPAKGEALKYDLAIWDSGRKPEEGAPALNGTYWGTVVYQREGITGTVHRVESPLNPNTIYFWSVRTRHDNEVGPWSTYDAWSGSYSLVGYRRDVVRGSPFMFQTPAH